MTGRSLRLGESILSVVVLVLGVFIAVETYLAPAAPAQVAVGPTLFPVRDAICLILIGGFLAREAYAGHVAHEGGLEIDWWAVALVLAALIVQMVILEWAGWIIATALLFTAVGRAFGSRRPLIDLAIGLVLTSLAFFIFTRGLGLTLPGGLIGELVGTE